MKKSITVVQAERYDPGFPPKKLTEFLEWLNKHVAQIPKEFIASAEIEFDSVSDYGDGHYAAIEISYMRPETDEEMSERQNSMRRAQQRQQAEELELLHRLKQKYGE
jgi:hypothetical protein